MQEDNDSIRQAAPLLLKVPTAFHKKCKENGALYSVVYLVAYLVGLYCWPATIPHALPAFPAKKPRLERLGECLNLLRQPARFAEPLT